jgi:hypothetical protein
MIHGNVGWCFMIYFNMGLLVFSGSFLLSDLSRWFFVHDRATARLQCYWANCNCIHGQALDLFVLRCIYLRFMKVLELA